MKRLLLLMAACMSMQLVHAAGTKIGDLYYELDETNKTATITYESTDNNNYSRLPEELTIHATVSFYGETYSVVGTSGYAFSNCTKLKKVTIEDGIFGIGGNAFSYCTSLEEIKIGNSVTRIGSFAFSGCTSLLDVKIGDSVTSIGYSAFSDCISLSEIKIGKSVTTIEDGVFSGCTSLEEVIIPASVTDMGETYYNYKESQLFYNCTALKRVYFEDGPTPLSLGSYYSSSAAAAKGLFSDCPLEEVYLGRNVTYADYSNGSSFSSKPEYYGYSAFYNRTTLKSVTIGPEVTSLPPYLFYECSGLQTLEINTTQLQTIPKGCFHSGKATDITIPEGVESIEGYAFYGNSELKTLTLPSTLTLIYEYAFYGASSLSEVEFPAGLRAIGGYGFYNTGLVDIKLPESLNTVSAYSFAQSTNLQTVTFNDNCLNIGDCIFEGCTGLKQVIMGKSAVEVPYLCFKDCTSLVDIKIGESVSSIYNWAFSGCTALEEIRIPASVTQIGTTGSPSGSTYGDFLPFYNCSALKRVYFEDGSAPLSLGSYYSSSAAAAEGLFSDCPLEEVYLGRNVTYADYSNGSSFSSKPEYYGYSAFYNSTTLKSVTIGPEVTSLPQYLFYECSAIEEIIYFPVAVPTMGTNTFNKNVVSWIPYGSKNSYGPKLSTYGITENNIRDWFYDHQVAYFLNEDMTAAVRKYPSPFVKPAVINITPQVEKLNHTFTVTSVYPDGFTDNTNITSFTFPETLESIGANAFKGCVNLEEANIPGATTFIGAFAFNNTPALKDLYLQRGYEKLTVEGTPFADSGVERLFLGRDVTGLLGIGETLQTLQVGSTVNYIGEDAFNGCSNLESVSFLQGNLTKIGARAFEGCAALPSINLPNTLETLSEASFKDCSGLQSIELSIKLNTISDNTFSGCGSLENIVLPEGITLIGTSAFDGCKSLPYINFPDGITEIKENAFNGCSVLDNITLPGRISVIGGSAFSGCETLSGIIIPNSVTSIGNAAFRNCASLESAGLSDNLSLLSDNIFSGCASLSAITVPDKVSAIGNYAFNECNALRVVSLSPTVASIGSYAFYGCEALPEILLPASLKNIGANAFNGCDNLMTVYSLASVPPTCEDADGFSAETKKGARLYVPAETIEDYMTFKCWKDFRYFEPLSAVNSITVSGPSNRLRINKTMQLEASFTPASATSGINWSSSNPTVATVDANGEVTAVSQGYVVITAKANDIIATEGIFELQVIDFLLGDSNESDDVTITDAVNIASYVMGNEPKVFNFYASDVNESNDITLADASGVITIILNDSETIGTPEAMRTAPNYSDMLVADNFHLNYGETAAVPVALDSSKELIALQADIRSEGGLNIEDVKATDVLSSSHFLITKRLGDDAMRVVVYSPALNIIPSDIAALFDVEINGIPDAGACINISHIKATDADLNEYSLGFEGGRFEAVSTGIENADASDVIITVSNGMLTIEGATGKQIDIYSSNGIAVAGTHAASETETFRLNAGIYIVIVGNKAEKVVI